MGCFFCIYFCTSYVCLMTAIVQKSEECIWYPSTEDKNICVLTHWRSILGSLEEKSVLLTYELFHQSQSMLTNLWSFIVITDTNHDAWLFVCSEESNSGHHEWKERLMPDEPSLRPRYKFNSILNSEVHNFCFSLKKRLLNSGVKDQSFVLFVIFPIEIKCPYYILFSKILVYLSDINVNIKETECQIWLNHPMPIFHFIFLSFEAPCVCVYIYI